MLGELLKTHRLCCQQQFTYQGAPKSLCHALDTLDWVTKTNSGSRDFKILTRHTETKVTAEKELSAATEDVSLDNCKARHRKRCNGICHGLKIITVHRAIGDFLEVRAGTENRPLRSDD